MSGHSKWSSIKHKKGAADAKRGKLFSKLSRAIIVAAKEGGPDPTGNLALQNAIEKARSYSMPKDNIERAIARGSGADSDAAAFEHVTYEGYGPNGVAVIVEALTDNRNRTASDVRHLFSKHDGALGGSGPAGLLRSRLVGSYAGTATVQRNHPWCLAPDHAEPTIRYVPDGYLSGSGNLTVYAPGLTSTLERLIVRPPVEISKLTVEKSVT